MTNVEPEFLEPEDERSASEEIGDLMLQANEKTAWARNVANELLDHANYLEFRAQEMRKLAAKMVTEAMDFNEEVAMLITHEFPMEIPDE